MTLLRLAAYLALLLSAAGCKEDSGNRAMSLHQEAMTESNERIKRQELELRVLEQKVADQKEENKKHQVWNYKDVEDKMSSSKAHIATVLSSNALRFPSPYDPGSMALLKLIKRQNDKTNVLFSVVKGQMVCSSSCKIKVKFDDQPAMTFEGRQPSDYSQRAIFILPQQKFVNELKKSKKTLVEMTYYQAGEQVAEFNTSGLSWQ